MSAIYCAASSRGKATYVHTTIHGTIIVGVDEEKCKGGYECNCGNHDDIPPLELSEGVGIVGPKDDEEHVDGHDESPENVGEGEPVKA